MPQLRVCPSAQAFDKLRLGRLTRNDVELVAAHLEQCDRCVETVRELQAGAKLLEILQAPAPKGTAFAGQRLQGLVQRLQENPVTQVNNTPKPDEATLAPAMSDAEDEMLPFLGPARGPGELGWLGSYRVLKLLGSGGMAWYIMRRTRSSSAAWR